MELMGETEPDPQPGAHEPAAQPGAPEPDTAARARLTDLYARCGCEILAYALRRVPSQEDAADVVADTFLVAWRRLSEIPDEPEDRLWLYGVARRALLNQRRGENRRSRLAERLRVEVRAAVSPPHPDERNEAVLAALAALGPDDRELLLLVAWEGLSPAQTAHVLEISPVAARGRLHRARRRLRLALAEGERRPACHTPEARTEEAR